MPDKQIIRVPDALDFAANTTKKIELPRVGFITHIDVLVDFDITGGASVTPAEDALLRIVRGFTIRASAGQVFFDVTEDARVWWFWALKKNLGAVRLDALPGANATAKVRAQLPIHLGIDPFDRFDRSLPIPAEELSNFEAIVQWGAASDLGTGFTVNSGKISITLSRLVRSTGESKFDIFPLGIKVPRVESRKKSIPATFSNLGLKEEIPTAQEVRESMIVLLDSAGNRTNTDASEFGVVFTKRLEQNPVREGFLDRNLREHQMYGVPVSINTDGTILFRWGEVSQDDLALDMRGAQVGDVVLAFTVNTPGGTLRVMHFGVS